MVLGGPDELWIPGYVSLSCPYTTMISSVHGFGSIVPLTSSAKGLDRWGRRWTLRRRAVDHALEAFFGCRELWDVMLWVCSSDVLLHRAIPLLLHLKVGKHWLWLDDAGRGRQRLGGAYTKASLATIGPVVVSQGTNNLIVGVGC